ncbi:hypothetical protein TOPH_04344 [Tolypocladium ophioglossoides CBS 100239]|uniref:Mid2 domain-containing protein n=1 Tax=Tolypocladium ophioglossoides (strain CBS 100239) TaxID=1163406 RepID=A0A0L0NAD1_TOLOC|nr:hypothetical protein TOPH_04344 [Tolypocladium ophioglossoides CBS 100239]
MARVAGPSKLTSLTLLLISLWADWTQSAATCYDLAGKVNTALYPCDTSADVSPCCGPVDFCLSNGLCLDAGSNNGLTQQGCTSQDWHSPCAKHCPGTTAADGFQYLMLCSGFDGTGNNPLCCGADYSCCNSTQNIITTIAQFSTLSRAAGAPATTDTTSSSTPNTSAATRASQSAASTSAAASSGGDDKLLAVGAGLGIPLGLALVAALAFLGWQMRKQQKLKRSVATSSEPPAELLATVPSEMEAK